jgi:glycosyltransferase involved in cell wall biosynthesis
MEWIVIDDGRDSVADLFEEAMKTIPNLRYEYVGEKMRLGAKRNALNRSAKGPIIIAMDDDDYYPPNRVASVVEAFSNHPEIQLAGSSTMFMYYTDIQKIYQMGPFSPNHATNGTMAWRKSYSDTHTYDEYVTKGEEPSFLDNYEHPMCQMNPKDTILVICHTDNTVDKTAIRKEYESHLATKMKQTAYELEDFVKSPTLLRFYKGLSAF